MDKLLRNAWGWSTVLAGALVVAACTGAGGAAPAPGIDVRGAELRGTIAWEGHFRRPHETRTIDASLRLFRDGEHVRLELREAWRPGAEPDLTVVVCDAVSCRIRAGSAARFAADDGHGERLADLVSRALDDERGEQTIPWQHPRLGDVVDRAVWVDGAAGRELRVVWHRAHDHAQLALQLTARDVAAAPDAFASGGAPAPRAAPRPAQVRTLAPGVHELVLADAQTRSLAIEFADHVVLCETSTDNHAGERLLAALDAHVPGKPVRYVLFGHYHPHYSGGLRPVLARGATVVAPPLGAAFARAIAARPFREPPDALAASGRAVAVEELHGQRVFRDDTNELVAIDIGADSHHTDEYVVFHLPRQRLLFQGDLGWFGGTNAPRAGGERAAGLLRAIDQRGLVVDELVQGWPTVGRATMPVVELRTLLALPRR
jgi:hypothetical protein